MEIQAILTSISDWDRASNYWLYFGYAIITVGLATGLGVTSMAGDWDKNTIKILGLISAICTGLLANLNPIQKSESYRKACYMLYTKEQLHRIGKITDEELILARDFYEGIIHQTSDSSTIKIPKIPQSGE